MNIEPVRQQMVAQQIRTWDVYDANILEIMSTIPRDRFVPPALANVAYADTEIPLAHGQCMLRPSFVGKILQALELQPDEQVLEIGTGTGYLTACLAKLSSSVTSIDLFDDFLLAAEKNLHRIGVESVELDCMDVMQALPDGHYDVITLTSAVPHFHQAYGELLKPGGRLFVIVGKAPVQQALLVTRTEDGDFERDELFETHVPELVNLDREAVFSF